MLIVLHLISLDCYYLPMEKGTVLHLNKLESPSPKDVLYLVVQWFLKEDESHEKSIQTDRQMDVQMTDNRCD